MSTLTISPKAVELIQSAAEAMSAQLPADSGWTVEVESVAAPIENSRVVLASLGSQARIAMMMVSPFARGLIVGPPPADSLEEALQPAFEAAATSLAGLIDAPLTLGTIEESTPDEAMTSLGGALLTVRFVDGDKHVASFVVSTAVDLAEVEELETPVFDQIPEGSAPSGTHPVSMLADVEMGVTVELGRARMTVADILSLTIGSVIELDRIAGSPVDVLVNGTLIARGEVVVIDEEFGVRVSEVIGYQPSDRVKR